MFSYTHNKKDRVIVVVTPYNKAFVNKARNFRGKWDSELSAWIFDDSIEDYVKQALLECYGTTGEGVVEYCDLLIKDFDEVEEKGAVELFGRTIAKAYGRDSGAKLGDDIVLIEGEINSGGSVKNWRTCVKDATFIIQSFPLERTKFDDVQDSMSAGWCEIKTPKRKKTKEQLLGDIAKCEEMLNSLKTELKNF